PVMDDGYKDFALEKLGNHKAAGPYSGGKYSVYEGGTRTPFITRWKGHIPSGVSDEMVCTIDLAASFASMVEVELPAEACIDSFNVSAALLGEMNAKGREHLIQQDNGSSGTFGLRVGDWKLQRHSRKSSRNRIVEQQLANTKVPEFQLFNLAKDPAEKNNVIEKYPEVAEAMKQKLNIQIVAGRSRFDE
ncbi:sulfatase-like hydrolase/transferase, partial [Planctomycetaceae bacterium]|nr:sulfatase-like hydrolase/transferase [Planctomycetaceae bacterium]